MTTSNHSTLRNSPSALRRAALMCGPLLLAATQVALTLGLLTGSAAGQTAVSTMTFRVSALVEARCSVRLDASSAITVNCSSATAYQVARSDGRLSSGPGTDVITAIVTFN